MLLALHNQIYTLANWERPATAHGLNPTTNDVQEDCATTVCALFHSQPARALLDAALRAVYVDWI